MAEAVAAEVGVSIVSGIASKVKDILVDPIVREISYVFKYQSYVRKLSNQVGILKDKSQMVEQPVKDAETQGDEIYDAVKKWFDGSPQAKQEAVNAEQLAADLLATGNFSKVSYRQAPERTEFDYRLREYQQFDSRMKVFQDVMDELKKESKFKMIGVYGMGGVGKTTLVKRVAEKVMQDKLFDEVVMAEVTQTPDLKAIQDKVAHDLSLKFEQNESVYDRADRLRKRLKKEKRALVILDNIWGKLDLEAVGIPSGVDDSRQCTILLTSRDQHVLSNVMNSSKNFWIEVLSDAEAMSLFWDTVGDQSTKSTDFQSLAVDIVGKCGGLPLAIKAIANALKNKSLLVWKNALNQLRNSSPRQIPGMDPDVYSSIKLSCDFLQSEEAKSLFRLCALQKDGSRILINDLVMYSMGLDLFTDVYTLGEGRSRVHALIDNLKTSCLLLDGDAEGDVKMHDIVYAIAVSIGRVELMHNIRVVADLEKETGNGIQKDATAVSLPYRDVPELPERLECPKPMLFLFAEYGKHLQIPDYFFEGVQQLIVLELRGILLSSLPSSLDCLIHLRTLSLMNCLSLGDLAIVGELKKLEILCFRCSGIKQLPGEIGQLTRLKLLDLRDCSELEVIAPNVISKLSRLEELYVGESFTQWEKGNGGSNASIVELKALSKPIILDIHIRNVQIMPHDLVSVDLQGFKIQIGDVPCWDWEYRTSRILEGFKIGIEDVPYWEWEYGTSRILGLSGLDKSLYSGNEGKNLLRTEYLYLDELNGFQNVNQLDDRDGFPLLRSLHVENSSEILHIVNSGGLRCNAFPMLESLIVFNLINLKDVCHYQVIECQVFNNLRIINVQNCPKLKHLFSFSLAQNCVRLQEIQVTACENLDFIVGEERESHIVCDDRSIDFTQLHSLILEKLPQLTSSGLETSQLLSAATSASKEITAEDDPGEFAKILFNNKIRFPNMEKLELTSLDIEQIWLHQFPTMSISSGQNLTKLTVHNCNRLKFLFPYSVVNSLVRLQELEIEMCDSLEGIIQETSCVSNCMVEEQEVVASRFHVFPQLLLMRLRYLPKLKSICQGIHILEWPRLQHFEVAGFSQIELLFGSSELLSRETTSQQPIFLVDHHKVKFPNLRTLRVYSCNALRNLAKFSAAESLVNLTKMEICNCKKMENIIELHAGEEVEEDLVVFSNLEYLNLDCLSSLESFCLGNYTLEFPSLTRVFVIECLSMKIFSHAVVRTPMLHQVQLTTEEGDGHWEGNLNLTIQ
ncbi:Disease resistance protein [Melia azedarach]|uniref:Disease resistance protein n=1 Tax=Melia azedarach TaxID=155640 RepID=A0ACC1YC78_MELAZ|nr:Disease resistance protein [Melia azedarach]